MSKALSPYSFPAFTFYSSSPMSTRTAFTVCVLPVFWESSAARASAASFSRYGKDAISLEFGSTTLQTSFIRFCLGEVFRERGALRTLGFGSLSSAPCSLFSVSIEASSAIRSIRCLLDSRFAMGSSVSQNRLIKDRVYRYGKQHCIRYTAAVQDPGESCAGWAVCREFRGYPTKLLLRASSSRCRRCLMPYSWWYSLHVIGRHHTAICDLLISRLRRACVCDSAK
jgi:hypothetical protein